MASGKQCDFFQGLHKSFFAYPACAGSVVNSYDAGNGESRTIRSITPVSLPRLPSAIPFCSLSGMSFNRENNRAGYCPLAIRLHFPPPEGTV
jgi:hypothetical protein